MDAQVSYEFHSERKRNPEKFKNQLTNQVLFTFAFCIESGFFYWLFRVEKLICLMHDGSWNAFLCCRVHMLSLDLNKDGLLLL
jgi:hypothetical protein